MWGQRLAAAWARQAWWLRLLRPLEWLFRCIAAIRRGLYRSGLVTSHRVGCPVVVVGNLTVGGSGKTPVVIGLVRALAERGLRAGVISRGYGAAGGVFPHVVGEDSTVEQCGDEPLLIYRRTGVPCVVAPSRVEAARALLRQFEVDLLVSDDGLQHYALGRDLEIALVDANAGLGNGFCLPAGPLREPAARLQTVDVVLYRGGDSASSAFTYQPRCLVNLQHGEERPPDSGQLGPEVYALAGIGQPEQFRRTLQDLGFAPRLVEFPDHHPYEPRDLAGLGDLPIIMTEKDAVKCATFAGANAWFLRIDARLPVATVDTVAALLNRCSPEGRP